MSKFVQLVVSILLMLVALMVMASAQITVPYTFTAGTIIDPDQMNANFSTLGNGALNRTGGAITGPLTTQALVPSVHNTYDVGTTGVRYRSAFFGTTVNTTDLAATGNLTAGGNLSVTGTTTAGGTMTGANLTTTGRMTSGTMTVSGATTLNGATYTWPGTVGGGGQLLTSNGAGTLSWTTIPAAPAQVILPMAMVYTTVSYQALIDNWVEVNCTCTITLPAASPGNAGHLVDVKNIGGGVVTVVGSGGQPIDGVASYVLGVSWQSVTVITDGGQWFIR